MTVCIGSAWGYGQAPSAVPYNWLDVSVIYRPELLQPRIGNMDVDGKGRILNHKVVKPYRTQKDKGTTCKTTLPWIWTDGILDRHFPLDIGVLHEAITLIINPTEI